MSSPIASDESGLARALVTFIPRPFSDMQAERDELVKRVFPQLRAVRVPGRGLGRGGFALGHHGRAEAEGKVLPICLAEIKDCQPYFIGLLGERYGWIPEEIPAGSV